MSHTSKIAIRLNFWIQASVSTAAVASSISNGNVGSIHKGEREQSPATVIGQPSSWIQRRRQCRANSDVVLRVRTDWSSTTVFSRCDVEIETQVKTSSSSEHSSNYSSLLAVAWDARAPWGVSWWLLNNSSWPLRNSSITVEMRRWSVQDLTIDRQPRVRSALYRSSRKGFLPLRCKANAMCHYCLIKTRFFLACSCPRFCTAQDQKQHPRALDVSAENSILCVLAFARPDFLTSVISAGDFAPQANSIPREQEVAVWTSRDFPCHQITVCESENKLVQATPSRLSTKEAHCLISDVQRDFEIFVLPSHFFKYNTVKSTIHSRKVYTASPVYSHSEE